MKRIIHFSLLILAINLCFLFSPKPTSEESFWGEYVPIGGHAGFIHNFDSNEFIESAISPSALMRKDYVRQGRPLYVIAGSAVGYGIYYTSNLFTDKLSLTKSMYTGYVCLNFIILLLALCLFEKIAMHVTDGAVSYATILILSVFIASNFMTKAFFWTAHQQMLAFLVPLLSIYISMNFIKGRSSKELYILSFMLGIGMLVYGSFLVVFTVCILYLCYTLNEQNNLMKVPSAGLLVVICILFALPSLVWVFFLKFKGIAYYNHEVKQYRQLVWILDTLSVSVRHFFSVFYSNIIQFSVTMSSLWLFGVLLVSTLIGRKIKIGSAFVFNNNTGLLLLNLACFGSFFMLLGFYADRLTFTLMPILLCLSVANAAEMLNNKKVQIVLLLIVTIWHAVNVCSYGPFA
ncbi:glycosyltransferase family 39 protein [Cytophaga aurantiaca]|uniref:glycosyltransferase family 39 protein n=1 Tax=Cytophaga aurantiaca TaxID=29530 RepID=UPI0003702EE3|nr:glycosyltransferase family 39 protein [Cytophaga aurantiaca]